MACLQAISECLKTPRLLEAEIQEEDPGATSGRCSAVAALALAFAQQHGQGWELGLEIGGVSEPGISKPGMAPSCGCMLVLSDLPPSIV